MLADEVTHRPRAAYLDISMSALGKMAANYNLIAITRVADDTVDGLTDKRISKSDAFSIVVDKRRIEIPFAKESLDRLPTSRTIDVYAIVVPKEFDVQQVTSLSSLDHLHAQVVGHGAMAIGPQAYAPTKP